MKPSLRQSAFTLVELLVVIAIIGILAAISMPSLKNFRAQDALAASTRQLLDDVARARQYAISQRTTVYMIFCPSNFWADPAYSSLSPTDRQNAAKLYDKQLTAYTFVTLRSVGEQPGQQSPRYLSSWRVLPEGAIIPAFKFSNSSNTFLQITDPRTTYDVGGFAVANNIPFPTADATPRLVGSTKTWVTVPFIAFNHMGQALTETFIPLARGSVSYARSNGVPIALSPVVNESPPGNSTNAYMLVHVDGLTGRARLEKQEFQ